MTASNRKPAALTRDSLILASSIFVVFGCIGEVKSLPQTPASAQPVAKSGPMGGSDGQYAGSSFTGQRSLGEFGLEIRQEKAGFGADRAADTMFQLTTYSFLGGDATVPRRVRIHAGRSCFFPGDLLAVRGLRQAPASDRADGVSSDYFRLGFSLAERVLIHEVQVDGSWAEANCTVTQRDDA